MKVALITEYDGTDFVGFQSQNNGRAVCDVLTAALEEIYQTKIHVEGCSRTASILIMLQRFQSMHVMRIFSVAQSFMEHVLDSDANEGE